MNRVALGVIAVLSAAIACAGTPHRTSDGKTTNEPRASMVVQINNMTLLPQVVRVKGAKNRVSWSNFSDYAASVNFPISVKEGFTCTELRPDFVVSGDRIESIAALGDNEDLTTPCPLKPGTYPYQVYLFDRLANRENPQITVNGKIEVLE